MGPRVLRAVAAGRAQSLSVSVLPVPEQRVGSATLATVL